jgi:hypothetical protein
MYLKLISKSGEWFDSGTEVFDATICDWGKSNKRLLLDDFNTHWKPAGHILARALKNGFWDEELCPLEEFEISHTEDQI